MARLEDYNKIRTIGGYSITTNSRIRKYIEIKNYLIVQTFPKSNDDEYGQENSLISCFDEYGNLKWKYQINISCIIKEDNRTVILINDYYDYYIQISTGEIKEKIQKKLKHNILINDYKSLEIDNKIIVFPARILSIIEFQMNDCFVLEIWPKDTDEEYSEEYSKPPFRNIHCYDMDGNLKWIYPWGITGIGKIDEDTVDLYDGNYSNYVRVSTGDTIHCEFVK